MSSRFPDYSVLGGYAPNSTVLAALSVFRIDAFGQTRYCWWMNRPVTIAEGGYVWMALITAVYESMVVGSTKAGVEISHPRLRVAYRISYSCQRACGDTMLFSQVPPRDDTAYVALFYGLTAPLALQGKFITPPFARAAMPVASIYDQCNRS